uniref:hypothetical protein n=1 Tax=Streptococcus ferus TaxID=1345 RepID=UPI00359FDCFD
NLADFENKIWAFKEQQEYSKRDLYLLLLYWLHNIGNRSKYKQDSPLISATFSKQTAIKFASGRNSSNVQYIYNIFLSQTSNCQYIETKNLQGLFESLEINWFEDEHKEVIFQDSIFPHNILSISKIEENEEEIIVNPNLMKIIDNINGFGEDEIRYVTELLKSWGITTNQKNFENRLKKLGYDKFVQDNAGRRSIQDEDGIIHDIGNTKIKE